MEERKSTEERQLSRREFLRVSAAGLAGAAAGSLLSSCAPAVTPTPKPATATPVPTPTVVKREPVTIKLMTFWWVEAGRDKVLRDYVQEFHEAQNDVRIEEVGFPYSSYWDSMSIQLAAGQLDADVVHMLDEFATIMMKNRYLEPLQDVAQKAGIMELRPVTMLPPFYWDDNKNLYVLPTNYSIDGLIYNRPASPNGV